MMMAVMSGDGCLSSSWICSQLYFLLHIGVECMFVWMMFSLYHSFPLSMQSINDQPVRSLVDVLASLGLGGALVQYI